jgi:hypothetical protein
MIKSMLLKGARKSALLLMCLLSSKSLESQSAVTCIGDWSGQLGDQLLMYINTKWFAYHFNLPFYYQPFPYSDRFQLHVKEQRFEPSMRQQYKNIVEYENPISKMSDVPIDTHKDTLYVIHFFFRLSHWVDWRKYGADDMTTWTEIYNDQVFVNQLKEMIAPRDNLNLVYPPKDKISVAVHVRRQGPRDAGSSFASYETYDVTKLNHNEPIPHSSYTDRVFPLKSVPLQFYIDQIKRLSEMYNDAEMFVCIFTNDNNPEYVMTTIKKMVNKDNITFDYRKGKASDNVVEDMFSMTNFDCLIRSGSNYSQICDFIGNYKVIIYPQKAYWVGRALVVDQVGTIIRD